MYKQQIVEQARKVNNSAMEEASRISMKYDMSEKDIEKLCQSVIDGTLAKLILATTDDRQDFDNFIYYLSKLISGRKFIQEHGLYIADKTKLIACAIAEMKENFHHLPAQIVSTRIRLYYQLLAVFEDESGNMFKTYWHNHPDDHERIVELIGLHYADLLILH